MFYRIRSLDIQMIMYGIYSSGLGIWERQYQRRVRPIFSADKLIIKWGKLLHAHRLQPTSYGHPGGLTGLFLLWHLLAPFPGTLVLYSFTSFRFLLKYQLLGDVPWSPCLKTSQCCYSLPLSCLSLTAVSLGYMLASCHLCCSYLFNISPVLACITAQSQCLQQNPVGTQCGWNKRVSKLIVGAWRSMCQDPACKEQGGVLGTAFIFCFQQLIRNLVT